MTLLGTDLVAMGCILGGAALGGAATLALNAGSAHAHMDCAVEATVVSPSVAISHGRGARAVIVRPDVRVHTGRDCGREMEGIVEIHLDNHMEQLDAQLEQLEQALEIEMHQFEHQLEHQLEHQFEHQLQVEFGREVEARVKFEEAMQQVEAARIKVLVKKSEGGEG